MKEVKTLTRLAGKIRDALLNLKKQKCIEVYTQLTKYNNKLEEITRGSSLFSKALSKEWLDSAGICTNRIDRLLPDLIYFIQQTRQFTAKEPVKVPTLGNLFDELNHLQNEFAKTNFSCEENSISVITDPIELEGLYLGPFEIKLCLDKLSNLYNDSPYYVIALDPNPAATNEEITHPHVSNYRVCEGDGHTAIIAALEQGRLTDFFTMVNSILNTYNPDSPYVSVYDWEGISCYDCGYICDSESYYYCSSCEHDFCESCSSYCQRCDEIICLACGGQCPSCADLICTNCISECSLCGTKYCQSCIEEGLCPTCYELEREDKDDEAKEEIKTINQSQEQIHTGTVSADKPTTRTCAEIQSDSMGEAVVLQGQDR